MAKSNILELAKQGDGEAIATLINRSIQSKGIAATAVLRGQVLDVTLKSSQRINQKAMVSLIHKGMLSLQVSAITNLSITAYQVLNDQAQEIWQDGLSFGDTPEVTPVTALVVQQQSLQIKQIPPTYQDIIIRFSDEYGNIKALCTLTELIQVINTFGFTSPNSALQHLLDVIATATEINENGDRLIKNITILQPGSHWQPAQIRLEVKIFFEAEGKTPPLVTLEAKPIEETPPKSPKQILLEDLSSLLQDLSPAPKNLTLDDFSGDLP